MRLLATNRIGATVTRSELEERFLRFVSRNGLPAPEHNVPLALDRGFVEADCIWRRQRLIVELDGKAAHSTTAAFEGDRTRDRCLQAAGWTVVRVTWQQLDHEAAELARDLRALLNRPT